jgi:hypothetical protein
MRNRELVEFRLQGHKLGIVVCGHGVHLFAGLPLAAHEAEPRCSGLNCAKLMGRLMV